MRGAAERSSRLSSAIPAAGCLRTVPGCFAIAGRSGSLMSGMPVANIDDRPIVTAYRQAAAASMLLAHYSLPNIRRVSSRVGTCAAALGVEAAA
jgi:hypothetical protein